MGTVIALLLVLSTLTACMSGTMTDVKSALPAMAEVPDPITYTVELDEHRTVIHDEDGALLVTYEYEVPVLCAIRGDGSVIEEPKSPVEAEALAVTDTFNREFAEWTEEEHILSMVGYAKEDRKFREESGTAWEDVFAYTESLACQIYQTEQLISISAVYNTYTGGAHPNHVLLGWNFDLTTGDFFAPEALAADSQEFSDLVTADIIRQAQVRAEEADMEPEVYFWENYQEIAGSWGTYTVSFDETGMVVGYSPYEMACYAAGPQVFTLEYELLQPSLSDHGREVLQLEKSK